MPQVRIFKSPTGVGPAGPKGEGAPLEKGLSAAMVAGKVVIPAPAVTASGPIIVSLEGAVGEAPAVAAREAGVGFTVKAGGASTDRVNWAVYG